MEKIKLAQTHKGKQLLNGKSINNYPNYEYEEIMEKGDDEIIITASIKINTKTKKGKKMLSDMIEKQNSPIKKVIQENDNWLHKDLREDRYLNMYDLPEEVKKELGIPDYNDYYMK